MKETKTVFHIFDASAFDEELGFLNEMSEKGWQLSDMRTFSQEYVRDDSVAYRYAIDYQHELSTGEYKQYRTEFGDQGWEYVTRNNDWYVFRKPYDPALPEEEYLIYTDEPSFRDMKSSVALKVNVTAVFLMPVFLMNAPDLSMFLLAAAVLMVGVASVFSRRRLSCVRCVPSRYRFHLWRYIHVPIVLLFVLSFVFIGIRASIEDIRMPAPSVGVQSAEFTITVPDVYGINAEDFGRGGAGIPYTITDKDGRLVSSGVLSAVWREKTNRFFWPGDYTLNIDWGPGEDGAERAAVIGYPGPLIPDLPVWAGLAWIFGWAAVFIVLEVISRHKRGYSTWI